MSWFYWVLIVWAVAIVLALLWMHAATRDEAPTLGDYDGSGRDRWMP